MYESQANATRPTIQFYWTPDRDNVAGMWINITSSPSKYSIMEDSYPHPLLSWLPAELSGIVGYERRLVISNTSASDLGYYWCVLEHPSGSPNVGSYGFSPSRAVHIHQPAGISTPCPSSPYDSTFWELLSEPECCEIAPSPSSTLSPTVTLTASPPLNVSINTLFTAVPGMSRGEPTNNTWSPLCCTREQTIIISSGLSIGLVICVLVVMVLLLINFIMIKMEQRAQRAAKLSEFDI